MEEKEEVNQEVQYYTDYMAIKSDATSILHNMDGIGDLFLVMCQELTNRIYRDKNPIFDYVREILIPGMFDLKYYQNGLPIIDDNDELKKFIENNTIKYEEYEEYVNIFLKISQNVETATPDEIEIYSGLFYKFYLKGGSAMKLIFNSYKEVINDTFLLTPDEEKTFLGDNSDYDFDFLINENIKKEHYDELSIIATRTILKFMYEIIIKYRENLFNNDHFIRNFIKKLKDNKPYPLNPLINVSNIVKGEINGEIQIPNDYDINKIGIVRCNELEFENPFVEKGKESIKFYLLRLMLKFKNNVFLENYEYEYNKNIYAEIIDVCVPMYESYDRKTKWETSINIIKINGVYCYNLNAIINDLEDVIAKTNQSQNQEDLKKINKRMNRLVFFKNLICIIPRLIYKEKYSLVKKTGIPLENYETICEEIIDKICPSKKIDEKLKNHLIDILRGIYLNFPETINPNEMNIFVILKQYFRSMLIDRVELKLNTYNKIFDSHAFNLLKFHSKIDEKTILYPDDMNNTYHSGFYAIFKEGDTSLYEFSKINVIIYQMICKIIDNYMVIDDESSRKMLCMLFLSYSKFIMYFNNYSLYNESLLLFINTLTDIYKTIKSNPVFITKQTIELTIIEDRSLLQRILNRNKEINEHIMSMLQYPLMKISLYIKDLYSNSKLCLRGSYAYNFHRMLRNKDDKDDKSNNFNDIDMYLIINSSNEEEFMQKCLEICNIYNYYFREYFSINQEFLIGENELLSIDSYVFKEQNTMLYQILLTRYIYLNENDDINIIFSKTFNEISQPVDRNVYRIVSHHIFEIHITNIDYDEYLSIEQIITDPYLINNHHENVIKIQNYLELIKTNTYENEDIKINNDGINFNNFYIQSIKELSDDYDDIISKDTDILIKKIYAERLLDLSTV